MRLICALPMATTASIILALVFLLAFSVSPSAAEIRFSNIRSDSRKIILLDRFGFTHTGCLELNVTGIAVNYLNHKHATKRNLSSLGFLLVTDEDLNHVRNQIADGDIGCVLYSKFVKKVYTFDTLNKSKSSTLSSAFRQVYKDRGSGYYSLIFCNCLEKTEVSMDVRSSMYNLNKKTRIRDYLSAGSTILPQIYFFFFLVYAVLAGVWVSVLYKKRLSAFRIHYFMLAVIVLKALNLLFEAEDKSYVKRTGSGHGWDVLFYMFSFLKGIMLFTLLVLIGTGWSFLKPYLQDKEKKVLMIVIPLQVVANVAQVYIDESVPLAHEWQIWKKVFLLVDVVCCCAVLFPIVWSIKNLKDAARTDGKAAVNLMKLTLFKQYYIVIICYIYFTRVVVFALSTITSYRYYWTSVAARELATLAFYIFTGYKFKPQAHNPYFAIDDEEEEAAVEALKEDDFEL